MQKKITDGTLDGDPPGSNDGTILRPLLGTSECIKEATLSGLLPGSKKALKVVYLMDI